MLFLPTNTYRVHFQHDLSNTFIACRFCDIAVRLTDSRLLLYMRVRAITRTACSHYTDQFTRRGSNYASPRFVWKNVADYATGGPQNLCIEFSVDGQVIDLTNMHLCMAYHIPLQCFGTVGWVKKGHPARKNLSTAIPKGSLKHLRGSG